MLPFFGHFLRQFCSLYNLATNRCGVLYMQVTKGFIECKKHIFINEIEGSKNISQISISFRDLFKYMVTEKEFIINYDPKIFFFFNLFKNICISPFSKVLVVKPIVLIQLILKISVIKIDTHSHIHSFSYNVIICFIAMYGKLYYIMTYISHIN